MSTTVPDQIPPLEPGRALAFWRRAVMPALLLAPGVAYVAMAWVWPFVTLNPEAAAFSWAKLFSAPALAIMGAVVAFPLLCLWGVAIGQRLGYWTREVLIVVLAVALVLAANVLVKVNRIESPLWLATISRLRASDFLLREPLFLQLELAALDPAAPRTRGLTLVGSSQILHGLDSRALSEALGRPVHRRALAGMFTLEACAASEPLVHPPAETAVFYLSPFDVGARKAVINDWKRMLITPETWQDLVQALGPSLAWDNIRPLAELWWSAHCRLWAIRDAPRQILFHLAGPEPEPETSEAIDTANLSDRHVVDPAWLEASFRALERVLQRMKEAGFRIVVFEGQINPSFRYWATDEFWQETNARIARTVEQAGGRYVPLSEYQPGISSDLWRDNTHVNAEGRRRLTQAIADYLATND